MRYSISRRHKSLPKTAAMFCLMVVNNRTAYLRIIEIELYTEYVSICVFCSLRSSKKPSENRWRDWWKKTHNFHQRWIAWRKNNKMMFSQCWYTLENCGIMWTLTLCEWNLLSVLSNVTSTCKAPIFDFFIVFNYNSSYDLLSLITFSQSVSFANCKTLLAILYL